MKGTDQPFLPGIDTLTRRHGAWLKGARLGLLSHPAALSTDGGSSLDRLRRCAYADLRALYGPEHGFFGHALAGRSVRSCRHPNGNLPVYSLYGKQRKPTRRMLAGIDTIVYDLQGLAARPYTFISSLRLVLEAAAEYGKRVIVADRPVALPDTVDGPMLSPEQTGFVAMVPFSMQYGMTPGESALCLREALELDVDLRVATMQGYDRDARPGRDWPPWIPPSQGIPSWESAMCYTMTVMGEALPAIDHGRGTGIPFQLVGARWLNGLAFCDVLNAKRLPGVRFVPHAYVGRAGEHAGRLLSGIRIVIRDARRVRPVRTAITILSELAREYGPRRLWRSARARPEFFDRLFGTADTRTALQSGRKPADIARDWKRGSARFRGARTRHLLYGRKDSSVISAM